MKKFRLVVLALAAGLAGAAQARSAFPADAAEPDYVNQPLPEGATVWHCWYDGDEAVNCRLGEAGSDAELRPAARLDPRLPAVVGQIWNRAGELADKIVTVPMHALPYDMEFAGRLASSAMCGGSEKPCGIIFARSLALLRNLVTQRRLQLAARQHEPIALNH